MSIIEGEGSYHNSMEDIIKEGDIITAILDIDEGWFEVRGPIGFSRKYVATPR